MSIKVYSVSLKEENIKKMKERIKPTGGKVSPIINRLIEEWIKKKELEDGNIS